MAFAIAANSSVASARSDRTAEVASGRRTHPGIPEGRRHPCVVLLSSPGALSV